MSVCTCVRAFVLIFRHFLCYYVCLFVSFFLSFFLPFFLSFILFIHSFFHSLIIKARKQIGFAFDDDDDDDEADEDVAFMEREAEEEEDEEEEQGRSRGRRRFQRRLQQQHQRQRAPRQRKRHEREDWEDDDEKDLQIFIEDDDNDDDDDSKLMGQRRGQKLARQRPRQAAVDHQRQQQQQQRQRQQLQRSRSRDDRSEELEMVVVEKPSSTMTMKHGPKRNAINVKNSGAAGGNGGKKIHFSSAFTDDGDEVALNVDAEPKKHPSATTLSAALKQKKGRHSQPRSAPIGVDGRPLQPISEEEVFEDDDDDVVVAADESDAKGPLMGTTKESQSMACDEREAAAALVALSSKGAVAGGELAAIGISEMKAKRVVNEKSAMPAEVNDAAAAEEPANEEVEKERMIQRWPEDVNDDDDDDDAEDVERMAIIEADPPPFPPAERVATGVQRLRQQQRLSQMAKKR